MITNFAAPLVTPLYSDQQQFLTQTYCTACRMQHKVILSTINLNVEFSFFYSGCYIKLKKPSLSFLKS